MIEKYLGSKQDSQSDLLQLLNALSSILQAAKVEVEAALTRCTELSMLCDTLTDYKQVPSVPVPRYCSLLHYDYEVVHRETTDRKSVV